MGQSFSFIGLGDIVLVKQLGSRYGRCVAFKSSSSTSHANLKFHDPTPMLSKSPFRSCRLWIQSSRVHANDITESELDKIDSPDNRPEPASFPDVPEIHVVIAWMWSCGLRGLKFDSVACLSWTFNCRKFLNWTL